MIGYYGFDNPGVANYLGIPVSELQMLQEILPQYQGIVDQNIGQSSRQSDYELAQRYAGEGGGGPMGGANRLENILRGLDYLAGHPEGSRHKGFNPTNMLANFATGGLYGTYQALKSGDPMQMGAAGASPTSPGGTAQINTEVRGPQSTLIAAGGTLAGAGLAGAFSSPTVGPEGIPYLKDAAGFAGQEVLIDPVTGGALPGAGLTPAQLTSMAGGAAGAGGGGGELALGLGGAQLLGGMLSPQGGGGAQPAGPALPAGPQTQGAPSGALLGGTSGDQPGVGFIDPDYIKSQKGKGKPRGIASQEDLSQGLSDAQMAALYGFTGR